MKLISVYNKIKSMQASIFKTEDLSMLLGVTNKQGYSLLRQLAAENLIIHLRRGLWAVEELLDPLTLPEYLTAPLPSYISLQSALYFHSMISQIPSNFYAVSIARTRNYITPVGTYSIHHIQENLYMGFDIIGDLHIKIAQPEKALFDFFYFKAAKSKLFYTLPELEIPAKFNWDKLQNYCNLIENKSRQSMVLRQIELYSN